MVSTLPVGGGGVGVGGLWLVLSRLAGGGAVLPYLGNTGTCRWTGYGVLALLSRTGFIILLTSVLAKQSQNLT